MRKFLSGLLISGITFFAVAAFAEQSELTGELIDQLMRKQAGEVAVAKPAAALAMVTAESALPKTPTEASTAGAIAMPANNAAAATDAKPAKAAAATGEESQPIFANNMSSSVKEAPATKTGIWGRMLASLGLILLMIAGAAYGLRKWPAGKNTFSKKLSARGKMIEVLSQHHLGPKRSLAIVRVAGEAVLIGITESNISILKTLALLDDDVPKENETASAPRGTSQKFTAALSSKFMTQNASTPAQAEAAEEPAAKFHIKSKAPAREAVGREMDEEFAMRGLRDIVGQKLKTMKEL